MEAQTLKGRLDFSQQIVVELLKYVIILKVLFLNISISMCQSYSRTHSMFIVYIQSFGSYRLTCYLLRLLIAMLIFFINIIKELATTSLVTPASTTINGIIESVIPANSILSILLSDIQVFSVSLLKSLSLNLESLASYFYDDKTAS